MINNYNREEEDEKLLREMRSSNKLNNGNIHNNGA